MERRSETEIAVSTARQIDGVVDDVDRLTHRLDDTPPAPRGTGPARRGLGPAARTVSDVRGWLLHRRG
ncbi:hypothetical protein [Streptomyces brasiliensis]|uniref:hypothetical protein n=1 Tax=Streptomyces brasiliensis TaxID=1954 RepID=UPI001670E0D5|nr:hypothetical protein [Streptomyces brasiliensis]